MSPPVLLLQVHLADMQSIWSDSREDLSLIIEDTRRSKTQLTEFFNMNAENPQGPQYLYANFPKSFVWHSGPKKWHKREKNGLVGRLAFASPVEGERYYLRLLLTRVPGPTSFDDILTVDGHKLVTFKESALKRGLIEDTDFIDHCLDEAIQVQMPQALRRIFATILIFCPPTNPPSLWNKYYNHLSEDFRHQYPLDDNTVKRLTCIGVEQFLESMGKSFKHYGLDYLNDDENIAIRRTKDVQDALDAPIPDEYKDALLKLNKEQREAYECIIQRGKDGKSGAFFIDGPGGTGKTFLYCALYAEVRKMGKIVLPTATSGIAASNIVTGRTAHSRFKIPLDCNSFATCDVGKQTSLAHLIRESALIIWDEAAMARKENIESLDLLLRDLCDPTQPFGGKVIVFGGDYRQLLPIVPKKTQE